MKTRECTETGASLPVRDLGRRAPGGAFVYETPYGPMLVYASVYDSLKHSVSIRQEAREGALVGGRRFEISILIGLTDAGWSDVTNFFVTEVGRGSRPPKPLRAEVERTLRALAGAVAAEHPDTFRALEEAAIRKALAHCQEDLQSIEKRRGKLLTRRRELEVRLVEVVSAPHTGRTPVGEQAALFG